MLMQYKSILRELKEKNSFIYWPIFNNIIILMSRKKSSNFMNKYYNVIFEHKHVYRILLNYRKKMVILRTKNIEFIRKPYQNNIYTDNTTVIDLNDEVFLKKIEYEKNHILRIKNNFKISLNGFKYIFGDDTPKMSSFEKIIFNFINGQKLPFLFVGDFKYRIGKKCPDFIDKPNKKVIEISCTYYKNLMFGSYINYKKTRKEYFRKYGYNTLFLNEHDINNNSYQDKIIDFSNHVSSEKPYTVEIYQ